jgi:hypothetical protein
MTAPMFHLYSTRIWVLKPVKWNALGRVLAGLGRLGLDIGFWPVLGGLVAPLI